MTKRSMFDELMQGIDDLRADREGKITLRKFEVAGDKPVHLNAKEVVRIREGLKMSQPVFAAMIGANPRTYPRWEKKGVSGPNAALVKLVGRRPELIGDLEAILAEG